MKITSILLSMALMLPIIPETARAKIGISQDMGKDYIQVVVDDYLKKCSKREQFTAISASVLISHNGIVYWDEIKTVMSGRAGYPPFSEMITAEHVFDIGSITKSFTSLRQETLKWVII